MKLIKAWELPIKTVSESNCREHWAIRRKRHQAQQWQIRAAFAKDPPVVTLPCTIKLSRVSPRLLDYHDNLPICFKWIVDELAFQLLSLGNPLSLRNKGAYDDTQLITWLYDQHKGKPQHIKIEIYKEDL